MTIKYDGPSEILELIDRWNEEMKSVIRDKVGIQNIKNDLACKIDAYARRRCENAEKQRDELADAAFSIIGTSVPSPQGDQLAEVQSWRLFKLSDALTRVVSTYQREIRTLSPDDIAGGK